MITYEQPSIIVGGNIQVDGSSVEQIISNNPPQYINSPNYETVPLAKGTPVTNPSGGIGVVRADATSLGKNCFGLLAEDIGVGFAGAVQLSGTLVLSDWTVIAGTPSLASKAIYYLSATPGTITNSMPTTPGQVVQQIGKALSPFALGIDIGLQILL